MVLPVESVDDESVGDEPVDDEPVDDESAVAVLAAVLV